MSALFESNLQGLPLIGRGKVRDLYQVGDDHLLVVATDRLSAFDVVMPQPIPGKGEVLTRVSNFWFARTAGLIPNHLVRHPGLPGGDRSRPSGPPWAIGPSWSDV